MAKEYHSSYSITTLKETKEDKIYWISNNDLNAALNSSLSGTVKTVSIGNVYGKFVGIAKYRFHSVISARAARSRYDDGCIDLHGRAVGAGSSVHTSPECCPTCSEPPVRAILGTEKWKIDKETPSTCPCIKIIIFKAIFNLMPETAPPYGVVDATRIITGTTEASILHQLDTTNYSKELKLKSQMCDDCYC